MQFAVNYSLALENLLLSHQVDVDLLKCPEWLGVIHAAQRLRPVYVHFDIGVGNGQIAALDYDALRSLLNQTKTPHLNCHLAGNSNLEAESTQDRSKQVALWANDLALLHSHLPEFPIVAENLPVSLHDKGTYIGADPALINEALLSTETDLLFDLSHARISCAALGMELAEYVDKLPMQRMRELHITGLRAYNGSLSDHFELTDADWQAAQWAQQQIAVGAWREPEIVALEYGGVGDVFGWRTRPEVLLTQIPRLQAMFSSHARAELS